MENNKPLLESEFRKILTAQMNLILDMMVTIGTLNVVLADRGQLPLDQMKEARQIFESLPKTIELRRLIDDIHHSASIDEILKKFEGTVQ